MYLACQGVVCDPNSTCNHLGRCVPADVDPNACAAPDGCDLPGTPPFDPRAPAQDAGADAPLPDAGVADADAGPPGPPAVVSLASGVTHACAALSTGKVKCWGSGREAQLGVGEAIFTQVFGDEPGETAATAPLLPLPPGRTVQQLLVLSTGFCALLDGGDVYCDGDNFGGILGRSNGASRFVDLGPGEKAAQIDGYQEICARLVSGRVKCWGFGGSLGLGDSETRGDELGEMGAALPYVDLGTGALASSIGVGIGSVACASLTDGRVKCWGAASAQGTMGMGDAISRGDTPGSMGDNLPAVDLAGVNVSKVSVASHACALTANGQVKCWGENEDGQLGLGDTNKRGAAANQMGAALPFVDFGPALVATDIVTAGAHTCVRLNTGALKCWGGPGATVGLGDATPRGRAPGEMGANLPVVDLGAGETSNGMAQGLGGHMCTLLTAGGMKCWGPTASPLGFGDLLSRGGDPGTVGDSLPRTPLGAGVPSRLFRGPGATCAALTTGDVRCWGSLAWMFNVARGHEAASVGAGLADVALGNGFFAEEVAAGTFFSCARSSDGLVKCWGSATQGALGSGSDSVIGDAPKTMGDALLPVDLGTGVRAAQIVAGDRHACVRTQDGRVKCWGTRGTCLGLGDGQPRGTAPGQMGDALPFVDLGPGVQVKKLAAGQTHTCALLSTDTVKCWGGNGGRLLGLGDTNDRGDDPGEMGANLPVVNFGTGAVAKDVVAAGRHACVLLADGRVKCWGVAGFGVLGISNWNGEMGDALPAVNLGTGKTAVELATSGAALRTCARLTSGEVKCWGENSEGGLGLGDRLPRGTNPATMGDALPGVDLGPGFVAARIVVGTASTCAVSTEGRAKCWGSNSYGQLGVGDMFTRGAKAATMGSALPVLDLR
jgi:alpha-tubulin suppressor-like RCC1 family protein